MATNSNSITEKRKLLLQFFAAFLKLRPVFKYFQENGEHHSLCISEITDCERHD